LESGEEIMSITREMDIDIDLVCDKCGDNLLWNEHKYKLFVTPCETCLADAKKEERE
jgi:hypothetical protein